MSRSVLQAELPVAGLLKSEAAAEFEQVADRPAEVEAELLWVVPASKHCHNFCRILLHRLSGIRN